MKAQFKIILLASLFIAPASLRAEDKKVDGDDIYSLSLEELGQVQVYSASKRPEKLSETPSAAFVLSGEDIKRSGATSIPEALRLVPGVQVARIDAHTWAVSIRGFNRQYSNKLLVMIDGRSVYTPLFSGVFWDELDYVLDDIDRVEVIRGPGGTLWGANAVNGIINIITKEARKTQGSIATATVGSNQKIVEARQGVNTSNTDFYRVYGKYSQTDDYIKSSDKSDANDGQEYGRGGFRYDFRNSNFDNITLQGDVYSGKTGLFYSMPQVGTSTPLVVNDDSRSQGANSMLKWQRNHNNGSKTDIQTYVDYTYFDRMPLVVYEKMTYDFDIQNTSTHGDHEVVIGSGYRLIDDNINNTAVLSYSPESSTQNIFSAFLQDKIKLNEKLFLTLGSKFEHNEYTGFEPQPNARISYLINENHSLWGAVSRAVRTPQRGEVSFNALAASGFPLGSLKLVGNNDYGSENLTAYEIGYRGDVTKKLYIDISAFYNDYDKLRTLENLGGGRLASYNYGYGENYGLEIYGIYGYNEKLDLKAGYTLLKQNFHKNIGSVDTTLTADETRSPNNQFNFAVMYKPVKDVTFDNYVYYVDNLSSQKIEPYIRYDTRLAWQPKKDFEVSLTGQNLFDDNHPEIVENLFSVTSEVPRAVLAGVSVKF
jgi:iron complex outermembrane receptor protein